MPYAREAKSGGFLFFLLYVLLMRKTAEEARAMLQGVGSRFDFHMNKTLCDLRSCYFSSLPFCGALNHALFRTKEIFDIIIDFPDSMGALQDLRVR